MSNKLIRLNSQLPLTSYKVISGYVLLFFNLPLFVLKVEVGNGREVVEGCAMIDPTYTELRFEIEPEGEPPGFFTGRYLLSVGYNNSLYQLLENPSEEVVTWLEESIREFLDKCMFSVSCLYDTKSKENHLRVDAYQYCGKTIRLRGASWKMNSTAR